MAVHQLSLRDISLAPPPPLPLHLGSWGVGVLGKLFLRDRSTKLRLACSHLGLLGFPWSQLRVFRYLAREKGFSLSRPSAAYLSVASSCTAPGGRSVGPSRAGGRPAGASPAHRRLSGPPAQVRPTRPTRPAGAGPAHQARRRRSGPPVLVPLGSRGV